MRAILFVAFAAIFAFSGSSWAEQVSVKSGNQSFKIDVKPASEGEGYSTAPVSMGEVPPNCVPVDLRCGDGTSASACCPMSNYETFCPKARIRCD